MQSLALNRIVNIQYLVLGLLAVAVMLLTSLFAATLSVSAAPSADDAAKFCKSVKANNTSAEKSACEFGYTHSSGDWQKQCKSKYKDSKQYGSCIGGGSAATTKGAVDAGEKAKSSASSSSDGGVCASGSCSDPAITGQDCDKNGCDIIGKYIDPAINLLSICFGVIAAGSIIAGGIQYSSSTGDPQKISAAKKRIYNTVIALVAYFFLYSFLQFIVPGGAFR